MCSARSHRVKAAGDCVIPRTVTIREDCIPEAKDRREGQPVGARDRQRARKIGEGSARRINAKDRAVKQGPAGMKAYPIRNEDRPKKLSLHREVLRLFASLDGI